MQRYVMHPNKQKIVKKTLILRVAALRLLHNIIIIIHIIKYETQVQHRHIHKNKKNIERISINFSIALFILQPD